MDRFRRPRLELSEGRRLMLAPYRELTPAQYEELERYILRLLPRTKPLSAHPDDLYYIGMYYTIKAKSTKKRSDLRTGRRYLAAATQGLTDIWRNRALCWYANSLLTHSTTHDRRYGLKVLRTLAKEADMTVAADAAFLLMIGYDQDAVVARRRAIAVAEATLARYKATVKELKYEIDTIRGDLEFNVKMKTRKSPAKRAAKR